MMAMQSADIQELLSAWRAYCSNIRDWQMLVADVSPKHTGCGVLYELDVHSGRPNESLAIADMRGLAYAEPHYHPPDNWEFYIGLVGSGRVFVGGEEHMVVPGDGVVIPPNTAHFSLPLSGFVIAAVNRPEFKPEIYITLAASNPTVKFDYDQFKRLTQV